MHLLFALAVGLLTLAAVIPSSDAAESASPFRPPSVPLVASDPYFSVWSPADRLTDAETAHWTGKPHPLHSMARIDGKPYRLMGAEPASVPPLPQVSLEVTPTRTLYRFENDAVRIDLAFLAPALPHDLDALSRPVTYLTWEARSLDGGKHGVSVYFDASALLTVNEPSQEVVWSRESESGRTLLKIGSKEQPVLAKKGDDLRIDWGYLYAVPLENAGVRMALAPSAEAREGFAAGRDLPADDAASSAPARSAPSPEIALDLGELSDQPVSRTLLVAYDDLYSIEYFGRHLRPYWRRKGGDAHSLIADSLREFSSLRERCAAFDKELTADLETAGGKRYARIATLAYRQALAGNKLAADSKGAPLLFPKENFSNGCIATVDVIYPMAPFFLLLNPALMKASLVPVLDYAESPRWRFPFAPHDLGTYPKANGQVYGGGERTEENQMPVEESGDMLLLAAAVAQAEGDADFAERYWPLMSKWADYLKGKGLDPENQLCTDDFAGHLAHNVNLSAKAIAALGAFAKLCEMRGLKDESKTYFDLARDFAGTWRERASDGDRFRLAFDKPESWSQKYNLVWDRILGLNLFSDEIRQTESRFYQKAQNRYGLPLDSRKDYTKLDWIVWTATLGDREQFESLISRIYDFLNETPDRVPMTDWYGTVNGKKVGFQARPVVGGVYLPLLYETDVWRKWAGRASRISPDAWAAIPAPPVIKEIVPSSEREPQRWRYVFASPDGEWTQPGYDDSGWSEGPGGFGTRGTPGAVVRTEWSSADVWLRRKFELTASPSARLRLRIHHDEDAEVYVNGVLAARLPGFISDYEEVSLSSEGLAALKTGENVLAVHCHQTTGGQYVDAGFVEVEEPKEG
jgi:hypothetical protein